jgi:hypothetical protein
MRAFYHDLLTALGTFRRRPARSLFTALVVAIGIAGVIAVAEIGQGTARDVERTVAALGANMLLVEAGARSANGVILGSGTEVTLTPDDCEAVRRECDAGRTEEGPPCSTPSSASPCVTACWWSPSPCPCWASAPT